MSSKELIRVLSDEQLRERLTTDEKDRKIYVVPMVDIRRQVNHGSLDLRLGTDFITTRRTRFSVIDPAENFKDFQSKIVDYQERIYIDVGNKLILHPNQLVLGSTLEYLRLPPDLAGYVSGRSSWGRLGLVIATATYVQPAYTGVVTLEIVNLGDTPIALYPGVRIAQLVFHPATPNEGDNVPFRTKYSLSTRPSFSRIHDDPEWKAIIRLQVARRKTKVFSSARV
ncbi:MAG: dCTP deaminase [Nitrososphaerales archaeon]|jgi:dCTP deaminase